MMNSAASIFAGAVTPSRVQAYAGRTLDLLRAIEKTVDCLTENCDMLAVMSGNVVRHLDALQSAKAAERLDPEGRVCQLLSQSLDAVARMHADAVRKRQAAVDDARLRKDDGVVEAYDRFIAQLSDHHAILHDLKEWVETHDALLDEPSGHSYKNVTDLFRAMGINVE